MGRGSTQILIRKIIEKLSAGPKTISELAESTGFDRTAIGKYVNMLSESGLLIEEQIGTSKRFTIVPTYRTDTYFGLPLNDESEQQINSLYHLIRKNWLKNTNKKLLNTHAQKIAFKVINSCEELNIPAGWYIHGGISIAAYDDSRDYMYISLPSTVEIVVEEVTAEYAKLEHAWEAKKLQYQNAPELYSIKEDILSVLYGPTIGTNPKNSLHVITKKVRKLLSLAPKNNRAEYTELLDAFQDLLLDLYNKVDDQELIKHKREIITLFEATWKYIALFNIKHDLEKYYSPDVLESHFILDIKQQEDEIVEIGIELHGLVPEVEANPLKKSVHDALLHLQKQVLPEEIEHQIQELEQIKKEKGLEAYNKELFRRAGLK